MSDGTDQELGPLAGLSGVWEGAKGTDTAPDDDPTQKEINAYRERITFDPTGLVENHTQQIYGLRYTTTAWRIDEPDDPFHEEVGYWLWSPQDQQVMRCFIVPRGVSLIAGGTAEANARSFELAADLGSATYGICSNHFLDTEFRTVRYELKFEIVDRDTIRYWEDTQLKIKGQDEIFHHTDENTLTRVE
jgi:hypothetical protein